MKLTRVDYKKDDEYSLINNGYFKCGECDKYAYNSELRMLFNLSKKGEIKISQNGQLEENSVIILCSACHDELSNK